MAPARPAPRGDGEPPATWRRSSAEPCARRESAGRRRWRTRRRSPPRWAESSRWTRCAGRRCRRCPPSPRSSSPGRIDGEDRAALLARAEDRARPPLRPPRLRPARARARDRLARRPPHGSPLAAPSRVAAAGRLRRRLRHQARLGALALPAPSAPRGRVPRHRRSTVPGRDRRPARKLDRREPGRARTQLGVHDGGRDPRGELGRGARARAPRRRARSRWLERGARLLAPARPLHPLEPRGRGAPRKPLPRGRRRPPARRRGVLRR